MGIEIDPHWYDVSCKRIEGELARHPLLEPTMESEVRPWRPEKELF